MLLARAIVFFVLGVLFQIAAIAFPKFNVPAVAAATLLLSFGDLKRVVGWSPAPAWVHVLMLVLGLATQFLAVAFAQFAIPLQAAGTIFLGAVDFKKFVGAYPPSDPPAPPPAPFKAA